jgi:D-aminopeptidase
MISMRINISRPNRGYFDSVVRIPIIVVALAGILLTMPRLGASNEVVRPRARDIGLVVGVLPPGPLNAITDVDGVIVGQVTRIEGSDVRTGVTVIVPHRDNIFQSKIPGAVFVGNGFGKLIGSTQVNELGEIESPIALTSTLSAPRVADALIDYLLALPGNQDVRSVNPIVGETNDGRLSDGRGRHVSRDDVLSAIHSAKGGSVEEGSVGAGTGTVSFGFKGGIGTSSRRLPPVLGGYTLGVLVQTNFGGVLTIAGAPVGQELGRYYLREELTAEAKPDSMGAQVNTASKGTRSAADTADGSIMIVIATDAPLDSRNLRRVASRAMFGVARTGGIGANDSGDYVIAFSTATNLRITSETRLHPSSTSRPGYAPVSTPLLTNDAMSPLFMAAIEATEEAIYNSLFRATTTTGNGHTVEALPIAETLAILLRYGAIGRPPQPTTQR